MGERFVYLRIKSFPHCVVHALSLSLNRAHGNLSPGPVPKPSHVTIVLIYPPDNPSGVPGDYCEWWNILKIFEKQSIRNSSQSLKVNHFKTHSGNYAAGAYN